MYINIHINNALGHVHVHGRLDDFPLRSAPSARNFAGSGGHLAIPLILPELKLSNSKKPPTRQENTLNHLKTKTVKTPEDQTKG